MVGVEYALSDGRVLLSDVSFRVGDGAKVALIGANGSGKTTLFRMIAGDLEPDSGQIIVTGGLGIMRQFIGSIRDESTIRDLLVSVSTPKIRSAAANLKAAEAAMQRPPHASCRDRSGSGLLVHGRGSPGGPDTVRKLLPASHDLH